jgi:hypothetical protein
MSAESQVLKIDGQFVRGSRTRVRFQLIWCMTKRFTTLILMIAILESKLGPFTNELNFVLDHFIVEEKIKNLKFSSSPDEITWRVNLRPKLIKSSIQLKYNYNLIKWS